MTIKILGVWYIDSFVEEIVIKYINRDLEDTEENLDQMMMDLL